MGDHRVPEHKQTRQRLAFYELETSRLLVLNAELLAVCHEIVNQLGTWQDKNGFGRSPQMEILLRSARAAIDKAEG